VGDKQDRLQGLLADLVQQQGVIGAGLVSRDGIRVLDAWRRETSNKETFSAMSATLMGAAEIALSELVGVKTRRVVAESSRVTMVVVGASDDLLLVALAESDVRLDRFLAVVDAAANGVTKVLA
jgi:predicted regulator of Ras-like GTPase activity (Roadblock/LC7/MglB family)